MFLKSEDFRCQTEGLPVAFIAKIKAARMDGPNRSQVSHHLPVLDFVALARKPFMSEPTGCTPASVCLSLAAPSLLARPPPTL